MLAVDTNVVVRFLTADDARQFKRAESLIAGDDTWVGVTVTLEIEGVLRSAYDFSPRDILWRSRL